mmetsp:Transcript_93878/g.205507  ORF Transcript_93878/g.205507 Transcript_93878/m.205507 type:complete len:251 (+) Transcript_93878:2467-3219(+)
MSNTLSGSGNLRGSSAFSVSEVEDGDSSLSRSVIPKDALDDVGPTCPADPSACLLAAAAAKTAATTVRAAVDDETSSSKEGRLIWPLALAGCAGVDIRRPPGAGVEAATLPVLLRRRAAPGGGGGCEKPVVWEEAAAAAAAGASFGVSSLAGMEKTVDVVSFKLCPCDGGDAVPTGATAPSVTETRSECVATSFSVSLSPFSLTRGEEMFRTRPGTPGDASSDSSSTAAPTSALLLRTGRGHAGGLSCIR